MPILDYHKSQKRYLQNIYGSPNIGDANKEAVRDFERIYKVKDATRAIMFQRLYEFLPHFKNFRKEMFDYDKVMSVLAKLSGTGTFETYRGRMKRFAALLNQGEIPKPLKQAWKQFKKTKNGRGLKGDDHVTWAEGLDLIKKTTSVQVKAMFMVQLDAGFRPGEFIDLDYGDCKVKGDFIIVSIDNTKTGEPREVELWRSVPFLLTWLQAHPTKRKKDPLWIQENETKGEIIRYRYSAVRKRFLSLNAVTWKRVATDNCHYFTPDKVKLDKPLDLYALRHASCFLDKSENVPTDIAAYRHGHSIKFFTETYGQEDSRSRMGRIDKFRGKHREMEAEKSQNPVICRRCDFVNLADSEVCQKCGAALTVKKALQIEQEKSNEIEDLKKQMEVWRENIRKELMQEAIQAMRKEILTSGK